MAHDPQSAAPSRAGANKTTPTQVDVAQFIDNVEPAVRKADALVLLELMRRTTGREPVMWGPSIIGFGSYHYEYASGRTGDAPAVGYSPRKASLALYGVTSHPGAEDALERLGKHKRGASCLYVTRLADVDLAVLEELIGVGYRHMTTAVIESLQSQRKT